jgi:excisionase family DNA binding protein
MNERLLYREREAAKRLGISAKTLSMLVMAGKVSYIGIGSRRMYAESDLMNFIEENRRVVQCQSASAVTHHSGGTTSPSTGPGIEEALAQWKKARPSR